MPNLVNVDTLHLNATQGQINVQITGTSPGASVSGQQDAVNAALESLRERMCVAASFDSAERSDPPRCYAGTRTAILSSTSSWVDDPFALYLFLWIMGWAGVGKSAILQTLAEEYQKKNQLAASFFFFQGSHDRNTIQNFVASIAYQIMNSVPGARDILIQRICDDRTIFNKSFDGQWQALVVDTLLRASRPSIPMLIVIDGVDECMSCDEQRTLLRTLLRSAKQLGSAYRLLIASRPEQQLRLVFEEFGVCEGNTIELADTTDTKIDIEFFLRQSLDRIHRNRRPSPLPTPGDSAIRALVKKASGQFIYAEMVVRFVGSDDNDPDTSLKMILSHRSKSFEELDYLYLVLMKRIQSRTGKRHHSQLRYIMVCVYWDLVARFKDRAGVLCSGALDDRLLGTLLAKLDPVVDVWGRYRHKSFREFLTHPSAPHPFSITSSHIASIASQLIRSGLQDFDLIMRCILASSPTPELIFCLANWQHNRNESLPTGYYTLWDNQVLARWTLGWVLVESSASRVLRVLRCTQIPLFLLVGLPYYAWRTVKQTSPHLYMFRTHDLGSVSLLVECGFAMATTTALSHAGTVQEELFKKPTLNKYFQMLKREKVMTEHLKATGIL
ncbi:hypothetical protein BDN72DRAFT_961141 [Pluteus cervinus]|uniref:Uncharacterized protein n=1 Tax=Pluteus cervinus TaxID=181527 RepID=A0ACD3ANM0_9AGAR|nr:hypothetical protein BDN72DRAFT_961141 [Pluteus cervinus]